MKAECPECGGPLVALLVSLVCVNECYKWEVVSNSSPPPVQLISPYIRTREGREKLRQSMKPWSPRPHPRRVIKSDE